MITEKRELPPDPHRRTGRSTRQADELIQKLFKKETIFFKDHAAPYAGGNATRNLVDKIIYRMNIEHPHMTIYVKQMTPIVFGMTIKFIEDQKPKALLHIEKEFDRVKFDWI
jgi:hypothetical protein